jgi:hypothetical protein
LWSKFDQHLNIAEEARRMLDPEEGDALFRVVRGALRNALNNSGGKIISESLEKAAKQIARQLMKNEQAA